VRDRGNGLKTQPVVYRWTNGAGWVIPTSYEVMRMKAVNRKPMIRPKGTLALQGGEEVSRLSVSRDSKPKTGVHGEISGLVRERVESVVMSP
jgi:putative transposase